jgi:HK97 family phage major capsid protein
VHETQKQIAVAKEAATKLLDTAKAENRDLNAVEQAQYDLHLKTIQEGTVALKAHSSLAFFPGEKSNRGILSRLDFSGLADYLKDESSGIRASLSEGSGGLVTIIPGQTVENFIAAYNSVDPFGAAGASIVQLDGGWTDAKVPFIVAGEDPTTYSELTGPSSDQPASIYVAELDSPVKYAFLTKLSEEADADIPNLAASLGVEGIRRCFNRVTKAVTAAFRTALTNASATVSTTGDNLEDLLNMIAKVPPVFAGPSNCWMLSRKTLALLRNTRIGTGGFALAFDPVSNKLLSYDAVINDYLPDGYLLFGDFSSAVHVRRSGIFAQRLIEAYLEDGQVGLRFMVRADQAFFAEAATASEAEQPVWMLTSDFGS